MNYYNENDPKAAAWLRELILAGAIPAGDVDERSIVDVKPHELTSYTQQHFFAGIGGWPLALRLAGWPDDLPVRTGSCPCQPFSNSGKRLGTKDERHLWPAFRDLIASGDAAITFGEQVASPLGREWLAGVRADLEGLGYEVGGADLCAACVGSPHIRQRLYWVAVARSQPAWRMLLGHEESAGSNGERAPDQSGRSSSAGWLVLPHGTGRDTRKPASATAGHRGPVEPTSGAGGLAHAGHDARRAEQPEPLQECGGRLGQPGQVMSGRLGHTNDQGPQGRNERILECDCQWPPGKTNLVVRCEDRKARRFEPGSFPLAHGVPNRVGLLRGYGNAIVPQLAAEFIQAACESFH